MTDNPGASFQYAPAPERVRFERRLHRFGALVRDALGGRQLAHVPNPGRMRELLIPGAEGWFVRSRAPGRVTAGTLVAVRHGRALVSIDTLLPNRLVGRALRRPARIGRWRPPMGRWRAEVTYGRSRFDFGLASTRPGRWAALLEVKSANLRVRDCARFPDAPTLRGARHVRELAAAATAGIGTSVLFVVQRGDVVAVGPNRSMDPAFADACDAARKAGVAFHGVAMDVSTTGARLGRPLPLRWADS